MRKKDSFDNQTENQGVLREFSLDLNNSNSIDEIQPCLLQNRETGKHYRMLERKTGIHHCLNLKRKHGSAKLNRKHI